MFIIRHAKAKTAEPGQKDVDRELASEGLQSSSRLGAYLYEKNAEISAIHCSTATRAIQTAELISDQINFDLSKIQSDPDLYEASVRILVNKVNAFNNDWSQVVIIGHNPVLTYFVEYLTGYHFDGMESGSMVKVSCDVNDWSLISNDNCSFEYYVSPSDLEIF